MFNVHIIYKPFFSTLVKFSTDLELDELINSKMVQYGTTWTCLDCNYTSQKRCNVFDHVEARHIEHPGCQCPYCGSVKRHRIALRAHKHKCQQKIERFGVIQS